MNTKAAVLEAVLAARHAGIRSRDIQIEGARVVVQALNQLSGQGLIAKVELAERNRSNGHPVVVWYGREFAPANAVSGQFARQAQQARAKARAKARESGAIEQPKGPRMDFWNGAPRRAPTAQAAQEQPVIVPPDVKITRGASHPVDSRYQVGPGENPWGCGFGALKPGQYVTKAVSAAAMAVS
jgi:hypothetical protein